MTDQARPDMERLDEAAARRLIERATELDARMKSQSTVADLREAARGAGISDEAFQWALSEVREGQHPDTRALQDISRQHRRMKRAIAIGVTLVVGGTLALFALGRSVAPVRPPVEERIVAPAAPAAEAAPASPTRATTKRRGPAPTKTVR